jgi:hypothetical protein
VDADAGAGAEVDGEPTAVADDDADVGAGAEVGGEPTATMNADAGAGARVDGWGNGGTPSGTSEEHYWMEQSQPSSSWFPCGRGWHRPRS